MKPDDLAAWMREEHDRVHDLRDKLTEKTATMPRINVDEWLKEVRDRFEHLRAHLIQHMGLEEHDGYLNSVLELRPTLAPQVEKLNREHKELRSIMDSIFRDLQQVGVGDNLLIMDLSWRISQFLSYITHHEEHEQLLVTYAFTQEIGTKD
jgi:hemerythrin-like domain-containing protein